MRIRLSYPLAAVLLLSACGGEAAAPAASSPASSPASASAPAKPAAAASAAASAKPAASAGASASAKPAGSAGGAATKITIGYSNIATDNLPAWVAFEGGYFQKNGLDAQLIYLSGGSKATAAMLSGEVQISEQGGSEVAGASSGGADLVTVATLAPVFPYVLEVTKDIQKPEDLKGKKFGISSVGGSADIAGRVMLRKFGLDPDKDVVTLSMGDAQTRLGALQNGAINAAMTGVPETLLAEKAGAHPLYNLAEQKLPAAQTSAAAQRSWVNSNKATVQKYIDSIVMANSRIQSDRDFTEKVIGKYYKLDDKTQLDATYDFYSKFVSVKYPHVKVEQFTSALQELSAKNEKLKGFDPSKIIDDSFVADAEARKVS